MTSQVGPLCPLQIFEREATACINNCIQRATVWVGFSCLLFGIISEVGFRCGYFHQDLPRNVLPSTRRNVELKLTPAAKAEETVDCCHPVRKHFYDSGRKLAFYAGWSDIRPRKNEVMRYKFDAFLCETKRATIHRGTFFAGPLSWSPMLPGLLEGGSSTRPPRANMFKPYGQQLN